MFPGKKKIAILRLKQKLKDHPGYRNVYVRSAKSHTDWLIELKTLLREISTGRDFFITGSGRLMRWEFVDRGEGEPAGDSGSDSGGCESQRD